ncbi:MAG: NAD-dependent epimerase/dehydratase family protein [Actinobacteria bacterium]|nr:MAG: NAD-dependent epimerase/dehydratase family protein [Actinomycetota bacterium]
MLVTGCAGFLGFYITSFLARYATELGIERIVGTDTFLLARPAWLDELAKLPHVEIVAHDIAHDAIGDIPHARDVDLVLHMASIASPVFYRKHPVVTMEANVWGLRRLLDFYGEGGLRGLVFFSSSEIYGDPTPDAIPTPEGYRGLVSCTGPRACYDEAKRFGETMCWVYAQEYGLPVTAVRPFNNYGPGMRLDDRRAPADFAKAVVEGRDIVLLSDGTPTRTFCYVADAVAGYVKALVHGSYDAFNIGVERPEITMRQLADTYVAAGAEVFGYTGVVRFEAPDEAAYLTHNPQRRCPDISHAREMLGYDPRVEVDEGVGRFLRFLRETGARA